MALDRIRVAISVGLGTYHVWLINDGLVELLHELLEDRQQRGSVRHGKHDEVNVTPLSGKCDSVAKRGDELRLMGELERILVNVEPDVDVLDAGLEVSALQVETKLNRYVKNI